MPKQPRLEGDPDEPVAMHIPMPLWLKRKIAEAAAMEAQDMTGWAREVLRREADARLGGSRKRRG
jgi:hypothetical protein